MNKTLESFNNDELASSVFLKKYALRDDANNILEYTLEETKDRLVKGILEVDDKKYENSFKELLNYFMPGGRIVYALGNKYANNATFSNCYVLDSPDDSLESIFGTAASQARIFSRGGGVGLDISKLRPNNSKVNNVAKTSTGAVSFMDLYSIVTGLISQNSRRGALMLTIDCSHPDLIEFIKVKSGNDKTKIQYANVSIKINNEFMKAVENNLDWEMKFNTKHESIVKVEKAKVIWDLIVESNWKGAEPGILFWDNILSSPASCFEYSKPISTNPCGEQPLPAYGSCNLGSMNLSSFVKNKFSENCEFDFVLFEKQVKMAVRFLDNINMINKNRQPLYNNSEVIDKTNAIGLGLTSLADMLIMMNLKYDSDEAIYFVEKVVKALKENTVKASIDLAKERGCFKLLNICNEFEKNKFINHEYFKFLESDENKKYLQDFYQYGTRNIQFNTVAPNGSLSIILQGSSGIEPIFCMEYQRTVMTGDEKNKKNFIVYHPLVKEYETVTKLSYKDNKNFVTSSQIDWKQRVKLQSIIQKYLSESISSTVNLPKDTTKEIISNIYFEAWKNNLKGITIYRDGCRDGVLNKIDNENITVKEHVKFPTSTDAKMRVIKSEGKKWYVTYTIDSETKLPNSLFVNTNSTETNIITTGVLDEFKKLANKYINNNFILELESKIHHQTNVVKTARYLSLLLRHRVSIMEIIKSIEAINIPVNSFAYRIKGLLAEFIEGKLSGDNCPECNSQMQYSDGCKICMNCGWSKCN